MNNGLLQVHMCIVACMCICAEVMAECLGSWTDFGNLWRASGCAELASTHIPIIIHEDAVPHFSGALC